MIVAALTLATCSSSPDRAGQTTSTPAPAGNPYSLEAKTIPVGVIPAAVLHDPQRNKDIEMSIEYPTHDGPYPVIIFSPGYGSSRAGYVALSSYWASRGYVVIKPSHADSQALREVMRQREEERRAAGERRSQRGQGGRQQPAPQQAGPFRADPAEVWQSQTAAEWRNRVADIVFIIDSLPRLIEQYPEIKERADTSRIGAGGHSYGAFTAMLAGGVRTFSGTNAAAYSDARVKAVVAMSPPGPGAERGLTRESWADLRIPTLFLTGTRDIGANESEDAAWRRQAFELSPAGDKWFVSIQGAGHSAFTGQMADFGGYGPERPAEMPYPTNRPPVGGSYPQQQPTPRSAMPILPGAGLSATVRTISLAFWDAYLKNDAPGRDYLGKLRGRGDVEVASK